MCVQTIWDGEHSVKSSWTHTKGPESKHNDDEVDGVGQEHQNVHVCDSTVLWMDEVVEELPDGNVDLHESVGAEYSMNFYFPHN